MSVTASTSAFSAFRSWLPAIGGGAVIGIVLAAVVVSWWHGLTIAKLEDANDVLRADNERVIAVNASNVAALEAFRAEKFMADAAWSFKVQENDSLRDDMRVLQTNLEEAARRETDLDAVITPALADALCMQHERANHHAIRGGQGDAAQGVNPGQGDTAAAGCGAGSPWRKVTYRGLMAHIGNLYETLGLYGADATAYLIWEEGMEE